MLRVPIQSALFLPRKKKFTVGQQRCDFRHFFDVRRKVADAAVAELSFFFDKIKNFRSCGFTRFGIANYVNNRLYGVYLVFRISS